MIKALFFDIDGTLVSFRTHCIPESTLQAVREARKRGIKVFIATGRPLSFINNLGDMEYDGMMCVNGAYCLDGEGNVISKTPVSRADIRRVVDAYPSHPFPVLFAGVDTVLPCGFETLGHYAEAVFKMLDIVPPPPARVEDALEIDVLQVIGFFPAEDEERIMTEMLRDCDANRWHPSFADCIARGTSKATGMDAICRHYGIDISETMAFGDGANDIEMLRHAGIGVAMGNAADDVKAAADVVTTSVDDDGVAQALSKQLALS